ncbi:hypothetical protein ACFOSC_00285 [Streptantibioticus rubrisoli]|uniref:Uncharacterized protein n=1 Tax=Streptantibioticus rubrisoli TaxID=1387313 RepID=A0ABT1PLM8_9ACTN|nr:hypothetical protein [Streptantibioticus rubrisoli]MCQ4045148.1 hypothetical protein [Streptantibioticus rubrisoli]
MTHAFRKGGVAPAGPKSARVGRRAAAEVLKEAVAVHTRLTGALGDAAHGR